MIGRVAHSTAAAVVETAKSFGTPDPNTNNCLHPHETKIEGLVEAAVALMGAIPGAGLVSVLSGSVALAQDPHPAAARIVMTGALQTLVVLPMLLVGKPEAMAAGALIALPCIARGVAKLFNSPLVVAGN